MRWRLQPRPAARRGDRGRLGIPASRHWPPRRAAQEPGIEAHRRDPAAHRRRPGHHLARYAEPGPDGLVFIGPKGGPLNLANFGAKVWRPARQAVGLPGVHFHDLRHFAAEFVAVLGATEAEIMARLGHATADMARRYQRATAERDAALARLMSAAVEAEKARVTELPRAAPS